MNIKSILKEEFNNGKNRSIFHVLYLLLISPSKRAIFIYRVAKMLFDKGHKYIPLYLKNKLITLYGTHISLKASIGKNLQFRHINGVVIGDGVIMGNNVIIYQQVTLGGQNLGDGKKGNYPIIGDNVTIFSGAKILGSVKIGSNSIIGANSVVIKDVPENTIVAGVPARVIKQINLEKNK